jgi:tol-pal system protein YbgF
MKAHPTLLFFLPALVCGLGGAVGCGRGESAEERQMAAMREEIDRVAEARDREDAPIDTEESKGGDGAKAAPGGPKAPAVRVDGPGPDVDDATEAPPPDPSASDDPEDATPRPNIRVTGVPGRPTRRAPSVYGADDQVQASGLDDSSAPRSSATDPEAKRAYESALALAQAGRYAQALDQFAAFLVKWPDHPFAENATFWRGESYFMMGDYPHALEQFEGVLARFQTGNKVPDALLKAGLCEGKLGNPEKAKAYFDRLAREYPKSDAARRIPTENK